MMLLGPNSDLSFLRVGAAARGKVIEGAIAQLDSFYVFPDVAKRMGDSLRAWNSRGRYTADSTAFGFAARLNGDVRELSHDRHMRVDFSPRPIPAMPATPAPPTPEQRARNQQEMDRMNCAFVKAEQLEGNVGYVKFDAFLDVDDCGPTASAAMNFVAGSRALIIDLRDNGGGSPAMVSYIASYLFGSRTHLNDIWTRRTGATEEFWTRRRPRAEVRRREAGLRAHVGAHVFRRRGVHVRPQGPKARDDRRRDDGRGRTSRLRASHR